jgi:hypothetical protein
MPSIKVVTLDKTLNICYRGVKYIKPMKKLFLLPLIASLFSVPVQAQQVTEFDVCTRVREVYVPGYYDSYGNYVSGNVRSERYRVPCNTTATIVQPAPVQQSGYYGRGVYCNPTRTTLGALLGAGVAASMSRGNGYLWSMPVGAAVGGAIFGCN